MLVPITCRNCGQQLDVPDGHTRAKLRCAECGVFNDLPKDLIENLKSAPPKPSRQTTAEDDLLADDPPVRPKARKEKLAAAQTAPSMPAPPRQQDEEPTEDESGSYGLAAPEPKEPERDVLIQGTSEDDGKAYQVTGDIKRKKCPECDKRCDYRAKVCKECGYNFVTKEKSNREFTPIIREWETGWPLKRRIMAFAAALVINLVILVLASLSLSGMFCVGVFMALVSAGIQAFLLGTFDTLKITRSNKGKVTIIRNWRICFAPKPPEKLKWTDHEGVVLIQGREMDFMNWVMCLILLTYGILPGVLFWWFVIKPDQFHVAFSMAHGYPETTIYRGTNESQARDILQVVMDCTGMKDNR
jgi:hypothetical protein